MNKNLSSFASIVAEESEVTLATTNSLSTEQMIQKKIDTNSASLLVEGDCVKISTESTCEKFQHAVDTVNKSLQLGCEMPCEFGEFTVPAFKSVEDIPQDCRKKLMEALVFYGQCLVKLD